jgi:hypothetical protein
LEVQILLTELLAGFFNLGKEVVMAMSIEQSFSNIGARVKVVRVPVSGKVDPAPIRVDIGRDKHGEFFQIDRLWNVRLSVPDADAKDRHLLLIAEQPGKMERFSRFLCGHDERAWFVAAIPEKSQVRSVPDAKDALKPDDVWQEIREHDLPRDQSNLRWTAAFIRQGEWFFLPRPWMKVNFSDVLRGEPILRGAGKPHWCEFLYRCGGEQVYVSRLHPNGLTVDEYNALDPVDRRKEFWNVRTRDAEVFVRGLIRHPDHATIKLPYWHKVVMNTETKAKAMQHVAFLD